MNGIDIFGLILIGCFIVSLIGFLCSGLCMCIKDNTPVPLFDDL